MPNVLFANPFFLRDSGLERRLMTPYFPLGLLYLAASARADGHSVAVFDGTFAAGDAAFVAALDAHRPDVVCIFTLITLRPAVLRLARLAAACRIPVVVGGPDASAQPEAYLSEAAVQAAVVGEGELTLRELLAGRANGDIIGRIAGLALHAADGGVTRTPPREPLWELDALPFPARDLLDIRPYLDAWRTAHSYGSLTLAASRGCPYGCEHCANAVMGRHVRRRSPQNVAAEMWQLQQAYAPDRFRFVDDLDGLGRAWLIALAEAMQAAKVTTPYEGLRPVSLGTLPMLAPVMDICAERNRWLPTVERHPHAPPRLDVATLQRRWRDGALQPGEHLEDP